MKITEQHTGGRKKPKANGAGHEAKLAELIQRRVVELELDGEPSAQIKLLTLEDIRTRLSNGELSYADAQERLVALKDYFDSPPPEPEEDQTGVYVKAPVAEFPVHSMPPSFRTYAEAVANGTLTDTTAASTAVLGGVSAVVGTRIHVRISESWCYHSGLYMVLLAPSSYGKSSVIEAADQPVRTLESELRAETASEVTRNREALIYTEAEIKAKNSLLSSALKKGEAAGNLPAEIARLEINAQNLKGKATPPVLVADDFTVEAVTDVLEFNDERVTVTSGDTGIFNIQRYSDNPSIELLLKCWKGEPHREIRRGRDRDADLKRPSMAMLVATQVENIKSLAVKHPGLVTRGLLPRFLPVIPVDNIGFRDVGAAIRDGRGIPRTLQAKFNERLINLARQLQANEGGGVVLSLDDDARKAFEDQCQRYENRMRPGGDLRPILEAAGKLPLQLQKLTGINWAMRACEGDVSVIVTVDVVEDAAAQLDYFIDQQHRLYDAICQAPAEALADKVREWCNHHPRTTVTAYLLRKSTARHAPKQLFDEAIDLLSSEGVVSVLRVETGGRPSDRVTVL